MSKRQRANGDTLFLDAEDVEKLKEMPRRPNGLKRKAYHKARVCRLNYMTWICRECNSKYFYNIARCPLCESGEIEKIEAIASSLSPAAR
ncbi:MAG: hypothetical protein HY517_01165 [Candidatus Aenigmarchaeota archaeon]|nr:hypothetical protein [Candidatus Aenigmarchaeota archaeon]